MVVEILGAKMLSPYVGLSHFVWTAQIAVTLVALACGYYVGGRLADRSQRLVRGRRGGNVGWFTSIGTLGSLAGTLLIGDLLIPLMPNSLTMYFTALVLMLICAGYFLFARRKWPAALVLLLALGSAVSGKSCLAQTQTHM